MLSRTTLSIKQLSTFIWIVFALSAEGQSLSDTEKDSLRTEINERLEKHKLYYHDTTNMYGLARAYAAVDIADSAFFFLEMYIDSSYNNFAWALYDPALANLKKYSQWNNLQRRVNKRYVQLFPSIDTSLAFELQQLYYERSLLADAAENSIKNGKNTAEADSLKVLIAIRDSVNLEKFETFISYYGWPSKMLVGREGLFVLFYILRYAPYSYQKKYYTLVQRSAEDGDVPYSYVAHLADKILKHEGKKQVYGTQIILSEDGQNYELYPVEDEINLNKRREELNMGPIELYLERSGIEYVPPKKD